MLILYVYIAAFRSISLHIARPHLATPAPIYLFDQYSNALPAPVFQQRTFAVNPPIHIPSTHT